MTKSEIQQMGADPKDYFRSSVAQRIFSMAKENQMLFAHYEYRWPVPLPDTWLSESYSQGEVQWQQGVLSELKYQSFRHDSMVCNFHPGQSSKWGAHELCHKLVGFAWKPNADLLFHVLAAWAAEVLPVTVFYFWDEVDCYKCPTHQKFSFAPMSFCHACESVAEVQTAKRADLLQAGWDFLEGQLKAIEVSWQKQRLLAAPYMGLDLADDAYHYISSQRLRVSSLTYQKFMTEVVPSQLYVSSIASLLERIRKVAKAIQGESVLASYSLQREDWLSLDIGFRGLELAEGIEEESKSALTETMYEYLHSKDIDTLIKNYQGLAEEIHLPSVAEFLGVGYAVTDNLGYYQEQVTEGIESVIPITKDNLSPTTWQEFFKQDSANRQYLGFRLQKFLQTAEVDLEVFLNLPQSFFKKQYSFSTATAKYQWSDRVRLLKNTEHLKRFLDIEEPYFLLYKSPWGEIITYSISEGLLNSQNQTFSLEDLPLNLAEKEFYLQNNILVEV